MKINIVKILSILDHIEILDYIRTILNSSNRFNYELFSCNSIKKGMDFISYYQIDIIILGLYLLDSNGFETFYNLRLKTRNIPIILIVSQEDEEIAKNAVQLGAQEYLIQEQINPELLEHYIFTAITRHNMMLTIESLANKIQENEQYLKQIIEKNIDSIIITDKNGKIRYVNPSAEKHFNKTKEELLGQLFEDSSFKERKIGFNIIQNNELTSISEVHTVEIEWEGQPAYFFSIRDISERKQIEHMLKESEKKYTLLFEKSPHPILILNLEGVIIDSNSVVEELTGFSKSQIINQKYENLILFPKQYFHVFNMIFNALKENKIPDPLIVNINREFKKDLWLNMNFSLINLDNEKLIFLLIQDITEIRQSKQEVRILEQTLHEMNALIENAPSAIFLLHQNGKILRANNKSKELFGYEEEEFLNSEIFDLFDPEYLEIVKKHYTNDIYVLLKDNSLEAKIIKKNGEFINVDIVSNIIKIADNRIIQSFISDITSRKDFERSREQLLDQLIKSLEYKSKFFAAMSHELRTPLNAIIGFSTLLIDGGYGELNDDQKDYLNDIYTAAEHLNGLINSILDLSKIEIAKFKLEKEEFQLYPIMQQIHSIFKPIYMKKKLYFNLENVDQHTVIYGDQMRFRQILYNLIDNAIKFTSKGGIEVKGFEKYDHWEFQIIDSGVGIDKEDYDVVFREFGRIENDLTKDVSGSGIGLALTKRLVELHGGEIWFESQRGKGTTFYFTIPKKKK